MLTSLASGTAVLDLAGNRESFTDRLNQTTYYTLANPANEYAFVGGEEVSYDAADLTLFAAEWGNPAAGAGATPATGTFTLHGRPVDVIPETTNGTQVVLENFPARTYDIKNGRWLQRDLIGYSDGTNLYEAFGSNAAANVDPTGEKLEMVVAADEANGYLRLDVYHQPTRWFDRTPRVRVGTYDPATGLIHLPNGNVTTVALAEAESQHWSGPDWAAFATGDKAFNLGLGSLEGENWRRTPSGLRGALLARDIRYGNEGVTDPFTAKLADSVMAGTQLASDLAWQAITSYASIPADIGIGIMAARSVGKVGAEAAAARRAKGAGETAKTGEYNSLGALEGAVNARAAIPAGSPPLPYGMGAQAGEIRITSRIRGSSYAVRQAESLSAAAQRDVDNLLLQLSHGNANPGIGARALGSGFYELRGANGGRVIVKQTSLGQFDVVGKFQGHRLGDTGNSAVIQRLISEYRSGN